VEEKNFFFCSINQIIYKTASLRTWCDYLMGKILNPSISDEIKPLFVLKQQPVLKKKYFHKHVRVKFKGLLMKLYYNNLHFVLLSPCVMITKQEIKTNCYWKIDNFCCCYIDTVNHLWQEKNRRFKYGKKCQVFVSIMRRREEGCKSILRWLINICYYNWFLAENAF